MVILCSLYIVVILCRSWFIPCYWSRKFKIKIATLRGLQATSNIHTDKKFVAPTTGACWPWAHADTKPQVACGGPLFDGNLTREAPA